MKVSILKLRNKSLLRYFEGEWIGLTQLDIRLSWAAARHARLYLTLITETVHNKRENIQQPFRRGMIRIHENYGKSDLSASNLREWEINSSLLRMDPRSEIVNGEDKLIH